MGHPICRTAGATSLNIKASIVVTSYDLSMDNQGRPHGLTTNYVKEDKGGDNLNRMRVEECRKTLQWNVHKSSRKATPASVDTSSILSSSREDMVSADLRESELVRVACALSWISCIEDVDGWRPCFGGDGRYDSSDKDPWDSGMGG